MSERSLLLIRPALALAACLAWGNIARAQLPDSASAGLPSAESAVDTTATPAAAISGNPAAVNILNGTGKLGELFGFEPDSGIRLGGLWIGDASGVLAGGVEPGEWGLNSLTIIDLSLDAEKLAGIEGGLFGIDFLQFTGQPTNSLAGTVQGFDSLPGRPPLVRQELYELWWRQEFGERLVVRAGKMVPTYDFNNVSKPVPVADNAAIIPAVTGVIFTPIFVNPTMLGVMPGYYNSTTGVTVNFLPTEQTYISYGAYDGSLATGDQTGLRGPQFDGHYFHIAEAGFSYRLGDEAKPGMAAVGIWKQTGSLTAASGASENGAGGVYLFGSQRLWFRHPGVDNSGISGYYQFGANDSNALMVRQYFGTGLTAFGLVPGRSSDSFGTGLAWSILNDDPNAGAHFAPQLPGTEFRSNELMLQWYYQMVVRPGAYLQPAVTYIPNPGVRRDIDAALAITLRLTLLF